MSPLSGDIINVSKSVRPTVTFVVSELFVESSILTCSVIKLTGVRSAQSLLRCCRHDVVHLFSDKKSNLMFLVFHHLAVVSLSTHYTSPPPRLGMNNFGKYDDFLTFFRNCYAQRASDADRLCLQRHWSCMIGDWSQSLSCTWCIRAKLLVSLLNKKAVLSQRWPRNALYTGALKIFSSSPSPDPNRGRIPKLNLDASRLQM